MRYAYADPPYPGNAHLYPEKQEVDHRALIARLCEEFHDGWALSTGATTLYAVLPLCPPDVRVGAWVKGYARFKPGVNPAYAWEPVIFRGGRRHRPRTERTVHDWVYANSTQGRGVVGAKPRAFCLWLFAVLGILPEDEFVDLFPGSGAVTQAWEAFRGRGRIFAPSSR